MCNLFLTPEAVVADLLLEVEPLGFNPAEVTGIDPDFGPEAAGLFSTLLFRGITATLVANFVPPDFVDLLLSTWLNLSSLLTSDSNVRLGLLILSLLTSLVLLASL